MFPPFFFFGYVSPKFLEQTLGKKLMSDMRVSENCVSSLFFGYVSPKFLEQTLDKKLMSDMRVGKNCVSFFFYGTWY